MQFIRKLFFLSLVALLVWLGIFTYNRVTDGFSIYQMSSSLPPCPQFEVALNTQQKQELQKLLDQSFAYLGKGCQCYVFESADKKYVIKFLKHKHLRPCTWLNALPMPQKLRTLCDAKIARRAQRVDRFFSSCKLAYEKMQQETGLLYIHLNRTPALEKSITIMDKLGFRHVLAIDDYEYMIQKRAVSMKEVFATLNEQDVAPKVQQLIDLILERCHKGIRDADRSFVQNVAFTDDGKAIFIDFGQFFEDPSILLQEEQTKEIAKRLNNLRYWTERYFPHFLPLLPFSP